jgi:hypothetical protein
LSISNIDPIYQRPTGFLNQIIIYNLSIIKRVRGDAAADRKTERLFKLDEIEIRYAENRDSETENIMTINII